jgi:hypothetical protein
MCENKVAWHKKIAVHRLDVFAAGDFSTFEKKFNYELYNKKQS